MAAKKSTKSPSRPHADAAGFEALVKSCKPPIDAIMRRSRELVYDVLPATHEIVWAKQRNIGYGTGPKKQTEHFAWLSPASAHVTLGFNYGVELPDPAKLLDGTGKLFRHVKLASVADVERAAVRALLAAAVKHRVNHRVPQV